MKQFKVTFTVRHGDTNKTEQSIGSTLDEALSEMKKSKLAIGYAPTVGTHQFEALKKKLEADGVHRWGWGNYELEVIETQQTIKEHFPHDLCPKCQTPSIPAEDVPDQSLRGCPSCLHTWAEDLSRPATNQPTDKATARPWTHYALIAVQEKRDRIRETNIPESYKTDAINALLEAEAKLNEHALLNAVVLAVNDMKHDIDIFYAKHREPGNRYKVALDAALDSLNALRGKAQS